MDKPLTASTHNKVLAFGLALTLIAWTFGVYLVLPAQAVNAHIDGTVVLSGGTVFKIMGGQRLGYPTQASFLSYNYQWSNLVPANSADLALPQGPNVQIADGALVNDSGTVFLIYGGQKLGFTSAAVFTGLGYKWSNVLTDNLSSYSQGANVDSTSMAHPNGTLVNTNGTIYQITSTGRAGIPTLAVFYSWGFDFAKSVPANAADLAKPAEANLGYRIGSVINDAGTIWGITSATEKRGFPTASCYTDLGYSWTMAIVGTTSGYTAGTAMCGDSVTLPPASSTGALTVSLASDTPAAGVAIKSAARVGFTKVNLTATGGDVIVDTWSVKRTGVGQDSSLSSVDIVDLSTNTSINESGKTFNTDHVATFSEDFTVKSGETKSVMLAGNMAASPGSGEVLSLTLQAMTLKGGSLNASLPITGNGMTVNTSITIGTATVSRGAYTNATNTALEVGKTAYTFFSFQVQAGSVEDVTFSSVKAYQQGSASLTTDLENYKLYKDGELLGTGTVSGNYLIFSFATQTLTKGQTGQYLVKADVKSGSARTVDLAIYRTTDLLVMGTTYNAYITPTYSSTGSSANSPVLSDNTFTISNGSLRVGRSNTVGAENITTGSNQVLGAFEFEAKGEPIIVTALTLTLTSSTGSQIEDAVQGVRLVDSNGNTVAGPTDVTNGAVTVAFTDTFTVPVGVKVYKVMATMATNGGWASGNTISAGINTPATGITAKGDTTGQTVTPTPGSNITTSTQTVKAAVLTVTKNSNPTSKSVITNSSAVLAGSWNFDATNAGENIRITSIALRASTTAQINNLTLKDVASAGGTVNATLSPVNDNPSGAPSAAVTSTFALSSPLIVTKGTTKVVDLYVDVGSASNAGEVSAFGCNGGCVTAYGATSGNTATVTTVNNDGALLTIAAAGTLSVNLDSSAPSIRQVVFGTTGVVLTEVRLKATNESINITKLTVGVVDGALTGTNSGDQTQIVKFFIKKDGAVVGSATGYTPAQAATEVNLGVNELQVPEGTTGVKLSILGDLVAIGTNQPGEANDDIKVGLSPSGYDTTTAGAAATYAFNATGVSSNTTATMSYTDSTGTAIILHRSVPSVAIKTSGYTLSATSVLHEADISAVGNTLGLYRLSYVTNTSTGVHLANGYIKMASCTGGGCGGIADGSQLSATTAAGTDIGAGLKIWSFTVSSAQSHGKNFLQIASGATAKVQFVATVSGFTTNSDSVSTSILGDTASTHANHLAGSPATMYNQVHQGSFVWSDLHSNDTDSGGLAVSQWYNGYYVTGLGATATTTPVTVAD